MNKRLEHVHPKERNVPLPCWSFFDEGKRIVAVSALSVMHASVNCPNSTSLMSHQEAITTSLQGNLGPWVSMGSFRSSSSSNLERGSSEACLQGPRPLAAALATRLKWMPRDSGRLPFRMVISCRAAVRYESKDRKPPAHKEAATSYSSSGEVLNGSLWPAAAASSAHVANRWAAGPLLGGG